MSNTPKLRFLEFKGEWEEKKLNSIFTKITQRNSDNQNSNVITNSATEGLVSQRDYFDKDIANKDKTDNYFIIKNGDFVYNPRKSSAAPYGPFTQYKLLNDGIVSPLYLCLRKNNSEVESNYLENYFKTTCWHQYIYENGSSGARHDRVSIHDDVLLVMPIKVPALPEQQKIADFLSNVDSIITSETKILNTLQKKKKALMQKLFTRQLRFKSDDETDFPAWEEKKLGEVCEVTKLAGFEFTEYVRYKDSGKIIALRGLNVKNGRLVLDDVKYIDDSNLDKLSRSKLYKNDILFTYIGTVGQVAVIHEDNRYYLAPNVSRLRIKDANIISSFLMYQLSDLKFYKKRIYPLIASSSQPALSMENIRLFKIQVPSKSEQQKITDCLSSLDSLIQTQQKVVTTWQQRKKALLQQMFI